MAEPDLLTGAPPQTRRPLRLSEELYYNARSWADAGDLRALQRLRELLPGSFEPFEMLTSPEVRELLPERALAQIEREKTSRGIGFRPRGEALGFTELNDALARARSRAEVESEDFSRELLLTSIQNQAEREEAATILQKRRALEIGARIETRPVLKEIDSFLREIERADVDDKTRAFLHKRLEGKATREAKERQAERVVKGYEGVGGVKRAATVFFSNLAQSAIPLVRPMAIAAEAQEKRFENPEDIAAVLGIPGASRDRIEAHLLDLTAGLMREAFRPRTFPEKVAGAVGGGLGFMVGVPGKILSGVSGVVKGAGFVGKTFSKAATLAGYETANALVARAGIVPDDTRIVLDRLSAEGKEDEAGEVASGAIWDGVAGAALAITGAEIMGIGVARSFARGALGKLAKRGQLGKATAEGIGALPTGAFLGAVSPEAQEVFHKWREDPSWEKAGDWFQALGVEATGFGIASFALASTRLGTVSPRQILRMVDHEPRTLPEASARRWIIEEVSSILELYHPKTVAKPTVMPSVEEFANMGEQELLAFINRRDQNAAGQARFALEVMRREGEDPTAMLRSMAESASLLPPRALRVEGELGPSEVVLIERNDRGSQAVLASGERVPIRLPGDPEGPDLPGTRVVDPEVFEQLFELRYTAPELVRKQAAEAGVQRVPPPIPAAPRARATPRPPIPEEPGVPRGTSPEPARPTPVVAEPASAPVEGTPIKGDVVSVQIRGREARGVVSRVEDGVPIVRIGPGREFKVEDFQRTGKIVRAVPRDVPPREVEPFVSPSVPEVLAPVVERAEAAPAPPVEGPKRKGREIAAEKSPAPPTPAAKEEEKSARAAAPPTIGAAEGPARAPARVGEPSEGRRPTQPEKPAKEPIRASDRLDRDALRASTAADEAIALPPGAQARRPVAPKDEGGTDRTQIVLRFGPRVPEMSVEVVEGALRNRGYRIESRLASGRVLATKGDRAVDVILEGAPDVAGRPERVTFEAAVQRAGLLRERGLPPAQVVKELGQTAIEAPTSLMDEILGEGSVTRLAYEASVLGPKIAEARQLKIAAESIIREEPDGDMETWTVELSRRLGTGGALVPRPLVENIVGRAHQDYQNRILSEVRVPAAQRFLETLSWVGLTPQAAKEALARDFGELSAEKIAELVDKRFGPHERPLSFGNAQLDALAENARRAGAPRGYESLAQDLRETKVADRLDLHPRVIAYAIERQAGLLDGQAVEAEHGRLAGELEAITRALSEADRVDAARTRAGKPATQRQRLDIEEVPEFLRKVGAKTYSRIELGRNAIERAQWKELFGAHGRNLDDVVRAIAEAFRAEKAVPDVDPRINYPFSAQPQKETARARRVREGKEPAPDVKAEDDERGREPGPEARPTDEEAEVAQLDALAKSGRLDAEWALSWLAQVPNFQKLVDEGLIRITPSDPFGARQLSVDEISVVITAKGLARGGEWRRGRIEKEMDAPMFEVLRAAGPGGFHSRGDFEGYVSRASNTRGEAVVALQEAGLIELTPSNVSITVAGRAVLDRVGRAHPGWELAALAGGTLGRPLGSLFGGLQSLPQGGLHAYESMVQHAADKLKDRVSASLARAGVKSEAANWVLRKITPMSIEWRQAEAREIAAIKEGYFESNRIARTWHDRFNPQELLAARLLLLQEEAPPQMRAEVERLLADSEFKAEVDGMRAKLAALFDELNEYGVLSDQVRERFYEKYLPRIYRRDLSALFSTARMLRKGRGWNLANLRQMKEAFGRLKERKELPIEVRLALGEILDPAYLGARAIREETEILARMRFIEDVTDGPEGTWIEGTELQQNPTFGALYRPVKPWLADQLRHSPLYRAPRVQEIVNRLETRAYSYDFANGLEARAKLELPSRIERAVGSYMRVWSTAVTRWNIPIHWVNNVIGETILMQAAGISLFRQPRAWRRGGEIMLRKDADPLYQELILQPEFQRFMLGAEKNYVADLGSELVRGTYPELILHRDAPGEMHDNLPEVRHTEAVLNVTRSVLERAKRSGKDADRELARLYRGMEATFVAAQYSHNREIKGMTPEEAFQRALKSTGNFYGAPEWARNVNPLVRAGLVPFPTFLAAAAATIARGVFFNPWTLLEIPVVWGLWNHAARWALEMNPDEDEKRRVLDGRTSWRLFGGGPDLRIGERSYLRLTNAVPFAGLADWALNPSELSRLRGGGPFPMFGGPLSDAVAILAGGVDPFRGTKLTTGGESGIEKVAYYGEALLENVAPVPPAFSTRLANVIVPKEGFVRGVLNAAGADIPPRQVDPFGERIPPARERIAEFFAPVRFSRQPRRTTEQVTEAFEERAIERVGAPLVEAERRRKGRQERIIRQFTGEKFREGDMPSVREGIRTFMESNRSKGELERFFRDLPKPAFEKTVVSISNTEPDAAVRAFLQMREDGMVRPEKMRYFLVQLLRPNVRARLSDEVRIQLDEVVAAERAKAR